MALAALSEVCTAEMCRDLASEVAKLLGSSAHYLKKKAILAATRIIRKVPDLIDEFMVKIENLNEEQHHGVLLSILAFIDDVIQIKSAYKFRFKKFVSPLVIFFLKKEIFIISKIDENPQRFGDKLFFGI